jgi:hypothetical protein
MTGRAIEVAALRSSLSFEALGADGGVMREASTKNMMKSMLTAVTEGQKETNTNEMSAR